LLEQIFQKLATTSVNNLALFGGGQVSLGESSVIDIYNLTTITSISTTGSSAGGSDDPHFGN